MEIAVPGEFFDDSSFDDIFTCKCGGLPCWPSEPYAPSTEPPELSCRSCGVQLLLVIQIYVPSSLEQLRVIYVFACPIAACSSTASGWTVLRYVFGGDGTSIEDSECEKKVKKAHVVQTIEDWGCGADEWGTGDVQIEDLSANLESLLKHQIISPEKSPPVRETKLEAKLMQKSNISKSKSIQFRPFYLTFIPEPDDKRYSDIDDQRAFALLARYQCESESALIQTDEQGKDKDSDTVQWDGEAFEEDPDKVFRRFHRRLQLCPSQCLRYELGGKPLISDAKFAETPSARDLLCTCGATRRFEMQLTPGILSYLELRVPEMEQCLPAIDLEWSTIDIYTCSDSCQKGAFVSELINLQPAI
jgi:pre-rRNA-processing protein TSR4